MTSEESMNATKWQTATLVANLNDLRADLTKIRVDIKMKGVPEEYKIVMDPLRTYYDALAAALATSMADMDQAACAEQLRILHSPRGGRTPEEWRVLVGHDMVELVPHGELAALKERDAARGLVNDGLTAMKALREERDAAIEMRNETMAALVAMRAERDEARAANSIANGYADEWSRLYREKQRENTHLHNLLAQRPAAPADPSQKREHNPFRERADDPRRIGSVRGVV